MSRTIPRYRFPSGDKITTCDICGNDTTGTGKDICDLCRAECSPEIIEILRRKQPATSYPRYG